MALTPFAGIAEFERSLIVERTQVLTMAKPETRVLTTHIPVPLAEKVDQLADRLRLLVGHYEMRYEIQGSTIYMLRLWHTREDL